LNAGGTALAFVACCAPALTPGKDMQKARRRDFVRRPIFSHHTDFYLDSLRAAPDSLRPAPAGCGLN
jgi:hypothetical protein